MDSEFLADLLFLTGAILSFVVGEGVEGRGGVKETFDDIEQFDATARGRDQNWESEGVHVAVSPKSRVTGVFVVGGLTCCVADQGGKCLVNWIRFDSVFECESLRIQR